MLFVYVAFALLPGAAAALPVMMSSLPLLGSLENCKKMTLDFVIKADNVQMANIEDDIVKDLAKIGITVKLALLMPRRTRRPKTTETGTCCSPALGEPLTIPTATSTLGKVMHTANRPLSATWRRH